MKKRYTIYYYFNDFVKNKEEVINLNDDVSFDLNPYDDIFKALDSCVVSPSDSVVDKIINFSKNMS